MLPKKERLNLAKTKFVGERIEDECFVLIWHQASSFKLAVVIPKTVAKKAVDRNRMRRLVQVSLKNKSYKLELLVKVKKNLSDLKQNEIQKNLEKILSKIDN